MDTGWIKIHRRIRKHWLRKNAEYFSAFIDILILCNHSKQSVLINGEILQCEKGQSIRSLNTWSNEFGNWWTIQKVRTFFKLLEKDNMISIEGLRKTTRLTVCNYISYQNEQHTANTQPTHSQHTSNTDSTTNKNDKNDKNDKKELAVVKKPTTPQAKFLESFSSLYESQTGYKFKSDKKHFIIIATLIKKYSYDEIVEKAKLLAIYCKQGEFWFVKEGWSCFTPETLSNHWNRIIPILTKEQKKKQSSKNNYDELKEQRRKTDELIKNTTKSITA